MNITNQSGNKVKSQQTSTESLKNIEVEMIHLLSEAKVTTTYTPQSSFSIPGLASIHTHLRNKVSDAAMSKIEGLCALYGALSSTTDLSGFCCVLTLYAKTHGQTSLTGKLTEIAKQLFSDYNPQSSNYVRPQWLTEMKDGLHNWKLLVNSPSFSKISRVLTLLVTLGCIESQSIRMGNFEIFALKAQEKQASALDLVDALIETIAYFAEGAYQCFLSGSLKPLLFSTSEVVQVEEAYVKLTEQWEFARNGNLEKYTDSSEAKFDKDLEDMVSTLNDLYKTMPNGVERKIIQQKWEALSKIRAEWIAVRISGGLRAAPFAVKAYGDSGVGKSTFSDIVMSTILKTSGVPSTSDYVATLNEADKYDSNYRSYITGIKIDDYGNSKSQFWEQSPSEQIIKIVNNIREYAVMADIANKGKITIEPKALVVTTNVEEMHAAVTSNNPMSILRRLHHHIELNVRDEFKTNKMLDSQKVIDKFGNLDEINDIWLITMKAPRAAGSSGYSSQEFGAWDIVAEDLSIFDYLNILIQDVKRHVHHQKCITDSFQEPSDLVQICEECEQMKQTCKCGYEPQFGARIAGILSDEARKMSMNAQILQLTAETKIEDYAVHTLLKTFKVLSESQYMQWTNWIPECWIEHEYVQWGILLSGKDYIAQEVKTYVKRFIMQIVFIALFTMKISYKLSFLMTVFGTLYFMICYSGVVRAKQNAYLDEIMTRRNSMAEAFKSARDQHIKIACGAFAGLSVIYGICQVIKAMRKSMRIQGSLQPTSAEEIHARDAEVNVWKQTETQVEIVEHAFSTEKEASAIEKSTYYIECDGKFSGCFMLRTNVIAIPSHFLPQEPTKATVKNTTDNVYSFVLNPEYTVKVGSSDMVLCYVANTGDRPNRTDLFATRPLEGVHACHMFGLTGIRNRFKTNLLWCRGDTPINNGHQLIIGSQYVLKGMNTFDGMCMSPIISSGRRYSIVGFHIGGVAGTPRGCGMEVLRGDLEIAVVDLMDKNSFASLGAQASEIPETMYGRKVMKSSQVHPKCPTNFLEGDRNIEIYGSTTATITPTSRVISTPISETIEKVTGIPNTWGPPKFIQPKQLENGAVDPQKWKPWYESLKYSSNPSGGFDPAMVAWAVEDYKSDLLDVLNAQADFWRNDIRPLSRLETVSGIDGKRFIDAMKSSTSMGFPVGGPKSRYLVDLEPTEEFSCPRTFTQEVWNEVDKLLEMCDNDESLPVVFSSNLKDEPTSIYKDKVRVFQASPVSLQVLMRMYFLPIGRFLSVNPLISECAVGINSHGPEWHALASYMKHFGEDRIIAGDFSKYDLRMPQQLTIAANKVFIDFAEWSGNYSKVELNRMRVIAHAVSAPLVDFNGTLLRLHGSNPSGQNMTVYTNSVVNSILHRMCFGFAYGKEERVQMSKDLKINRELRFRDVVKLATYGDDAKGSVRQGYDKFNHIQMAEKLAENGIGFTMPDKESAPVAFMRDDEADFLKRKNEFNQDLGLIVGKLEEKSLFKSLHSILKSNAVSPFTVSALNVDSALREWFFHGEEIFEHRRTQMQAVADEHSLPCATLGDDYQTRVEAFKEKYNYSPQSGIVEKEEAWSEITIEHPMFEGLTGINKQIVGQANVLAGLPENDIRFTHIDMLNKLMTVTPRRSRSTRRAWKSTKRACEIILIWTQNNTLDIWTYEDEMKIIDPPKAADNESELVDEVKEILGKPTFEEYGVLEKIGGKGDLAYISEGTVLAIEVKRVVGRTLKHANRVEEQAIKYATVWKDIMSPRWTVYAITYTEYGFALVDVFGEPKFPKKFAALLDDIKITY